MEKNNLDIIAIDGVSSYNFTLQLCEDFTGSSLLNAFDEVHISDDDFSFCIVISYGLFVEDDKKNNDIEYKVEMRYVEDENGNDPLLYRVLTKRKIPLNDINYQELIVELENNSNQKIMHYYFNTEIIKYGGGFPGYGKYQIVLSYKKNGGNYKLACLHPLLVKKN